VKRIAIVLPLFFLPIAGTAQVPKAQEVPSAITALADLPPDELPPKPVPWTSPGGAMVLHGDFFADGRHLALAASDGTTLLEGSKDGWKILDRWEVLPAWVPKGEKPEDLGYDHCDPPEVPFVLKDLTGDGIPEALVAFENDGYQVGYAIAMKEESGVKLLDVRSESGEPELRQGYMAVPSAHSGRRAEWGSTTFYRWEKGKPVAAAVCVDDARPNTGIRKIAVRLLPGGKQQAYEIVHEGGPWKIRSGEWDGGVGMSELKDFAKVSFTPDPFAGDGVEAFIAANALLFERLTGLPAAISVEDPDRKEDFAKFLPQLKIEAEGSDEAKKQLREGASTSGK
jgi:hypothetical protein